MATIITTECINCGACEPECPNTAIYQGGVEYDLAGKKVTALQAEYFYIVPEKCTECVGFFDYEACAAVCPVDCCVTDPQRMETEEALFERAKVLHPEKNFGAEFPSRFHPGGGAVADASPTVAVAEPEAPPAGNTAAQLPAAPQVSADLDDFEIPVRCRSCAGDFGVSMRFFRPGIVLRCPHCGYNFTPGQRLFLAVRERLATFAVELGRQLDRYQANVEVAQIELEDTTAELRQSAVSDIKALVVERTESRKAGIFG